MLEKDSLRCDLTKLRESLDRICQFAIGDAFGKKLIQNRPSPGDQDSRTASSFDCCGLISSYASTELYGSEPHGTKVANNPNFISVWTLEVRSCIFAAGHVRELYLSGISVLAPNSSALYTHSGMPAHFSCVWLGAGLST